jgi:uncharacterized protein YyaL (SSP411 family)
MSNRLTSENSSYLLQHADNPVEWYPWGNEALEKAQKEDKPIFLSIGYAACHWCHVMAHESFEDRDTAAVMNAHFVNIKVDREERPDLDAIYMNAVVSMIGQGGWPLSVFLTPSGEPFYGGTYFPPVRRYNMPSFKEVLATVARVWGDDRSRVLESSAQISDHLRAAQSLNLSRQQLRPSALVEATDKLIQSYDWQHGGWGSAPKFPQPMTIKFLLLRAVNGDQQALNVATHALTAMAKGGMYDVVGGGFARYSTDNDWLVPHFEKMLYDNALLARCYLHAYLLTRHIEYRQVCEQTLDFLIHEMTHRDGDEDTYTGGFYSSLDADSEGEEGKFYLWTQDEITDVLTRAQKFDIDSEEPKWEQVFLTAYGVTAQGNFEGKTVLQREMDDRRLAERFNLSETRLRELLDEMHAHLLQARDKRVRPATDDKVLVAWNALALIAFAEAARYLQRDDYLEAARRNADFLITELQPRGQLLRSWRNGSAQHSAYLEDYAALILGLLALYQSDPDTWWFSSALQLADDMLAHFQDPTGGFFDTRDDSDNLLIRPKGLQDNATPSGNALAAMALLQLSTYTGKGDWHDFAEAMLESIQSVAIRFPTGFAEWLCGIDFALSQVKEVAILGKPDDSQTKAMIEKLWSHYRPNIVVAISSVGSETSVTPLLHQRVLINDQPTAYVCEQFVCQRPVNSPDELARLLER